METQSFQKKVMRFEISKKDGPRPYKIIRAIDGKIVGSSETRQKARSSISWRMAGIATRGIDKR